MGFEIESREPELADDFVLDQTPEIVIPAGFVQLLNEHEGVANAMNMPIKVVIEERFGKRLITVYT